LIKLQVNQHREPPWGVAIQEPQALHLGGQPWIATPPKAAARDDGQYVSGYSRVGKLILLICDNLRHLRIVHCMHA
jgi:hypothetical protein